MAEQKQSKKTGNTTGGAVAAKVKKFDKIATDHKAQQATIQPKPKTDSQKPTPVTNTYQPTLDKNGFYVPTDAPDNKPTSVITGLYAPSGNKYTPEEIAKLAKAGKIEMVDASVTPEVPLKAPPLKGQVNASGEEKVDKWDTLKYKEKKRAKYHAGVITDVNGVPTKIAYHYSGEGQAEQRQSSNDFVKELQNKQEKGIHRNGTRVDNTKTHNTSNKNTLQVTEVTTYPTTYTPIGPIMNSISYNPSYSPIMSMFAYCPSSCGAGPIISSSSYCQSSCGPILSSMGY